jgi:hypothetical protein
VINQAELIVFVESPQVKYLKHFPEFKSTNKVDVLVQCITTRSIKERPNGD